ncbi:MAG TPA: DEAD/DEAH box helicase, partial [Burkholderiaceae bacterium]|nr:DEAD/DEAH box helicase [Burkholderiaceae bacterium]
MTARPAVPPPGGCAVELAGEALWLLPERALWWPAQSMLLVADVHLGKAQSFRRLGVPVPGGSGAESLARLSGLIAALRARELV